MFDAASEMYPTKAPGPTEMHTLFHRKCWDIVRPDVASSMGLECCPSTPC